MGQLRTANRRRQRSRVRTLAPHPAASGTLPWHATGLASDPDDGVDGRPRDPITIVGRADIPGGGELHLAQCGPDFSIQFGTDELMGSQDHVSEEALATLACDRMADKGGRVLIGGLGMGFTLRAALSCFDASAEIIVAELVPEVVVWARGPLAHIFDGILDDPRVSIARADVHDVIADATAPFDAILLDVDNGPDSFMRPENDRLYCNWGLRSAHAALKPGGILAIWSAYPDRHFPDRLKTAGFAVEEIATPAYPGSRDAWHHIWFASKPIV